MTCKASAIKAVPAICRIASRNRAHARRIGDQHQPHRGAGAPVGSIAAGLERRCSDAFHEVPFFRHLPCDRRGVRPVAIGNRKAHIVAAPCAAIGARSAPAPSRDGPPKGRRGGVPSTIGDIKPKRRSRRVTSPPPDPSGEVAHRIGIDGEQALVTPMTCAMAGNSPGHHVG